MVVNSNPRAPSKCLPITTAEFFKALRAIWAPFPGPGKETPRFGVAVSGGVDSMAMASLCASLKKKYGLEDNIRRFKFHAFIVDHGVRPNSLKEAKWVQRELFSWGLKARILTVNWPQDGGDSQPSSKLETMARKLRYQALGRACLEHNIQSLLVAHHEDDQAETVMMRIAEGHRGIGLRGMLPVADIPECWAIHGLHRSGAEEAAERTAEVMGKPRGLLHGDSKHLQRNLDKQRSPPLKIEDGGIKIYRPFLGFDKERLKATCRRSKVTWVEDETNQNPALTPRNAIRQLLRLRGLPVAIQKASLLALARRAQIKRATRMRRADGMFRLCMLDTRVGAMIVRLAHKVVDRSVVPATHLRQVLLDKQYQCALVLRRMMDMVTPAQLISLEDLYPAAKALFPEQVGLTSGEQISKLTCGGVNFERVRSDLQKNQLTILDPEFVWILTRQPFASSSASPSLTFSRVTESNKHSPFSLWDGRFWFRIVNPHFKPVVVRPFYPADLTLLRATLSKEKAKHLDEFLRVVAPGKIRWTLPVIAEAEENTEQGKEGSHEAVENSQDSIQNSHEAIEDSQETTEDKYEAKNLNNETEEERRHQQPSEDNYNNPEAAAQVNHHHHHQPMIQPSNNNNNNNNNNDNNTASAKTSSSETSTSTPNPKSSSSSTKPPKPIKFIHRKGGKILALPTLNWDFGAEKRGITFEVRYKKVKFPNHKNFESVIL